MSMHWYLLYLVNGLRYIIFCTKTRTVNTVSNIASSSKNYQKNNIAGAIRIDYYLLSFEA